MHYINKSRLSKLSVQALRQECIKREIEISGGAQQKTCISKLLEWKNSEDSEDEESDAEDEESELPYDLHYINKSRLSKLSVQALRQECIKREIEISGGAQQKTCISKLLEWKNPQKTGESNAIAWHEPKVGDFVRMSWLLTDESYGWFHGEIKKITVRKKGSVITVKWREGGKDKLFPNAFLKKNYGKEWNYIRNI